MSHIRTLASNPLSGFRHEAVPVEAWGGASVIVRAPTPGDHLFHVKLLWDAAGVDPAKDDEATVQAKIKSPGVDYTRAAAGLLVRVLFEETADGPRRIFSDSEIDEVAVAYGPPHAVLLAKALELGNLVEGAAVAAKKPSRKRRTSGS